MWSGRVVAKYFPSKWQGKVYSNTIAKTKLFTSDSLMCIEMAIAYNSFGGNGKYYCRIRTYRHQNLYTKIKLNGEVCMKCAMWYGYIIAMCLFQHIEMPSEKRITEMNGVEYTFITQRRWLLLSIHLIKIQFFQSKFSIFVQNSIIGYRWNSSNQELEPNYWWKVRCEQFFFFFCKSTSIQSDRFINKNNIVIPLKRLSLWYSPLYMSKVYKRMWMDLDT